MTELDTRTLTIAGSNARILTAADPIGLRCGTAGCRANCCTKSAPVVLNPYEIALICRESGMTYEDLLDVVETERAKGFPLVLLPRDPACRFWTGAGCSIYPSRPLACRLYPLGRVFDSGESHIVLPELNVCEGLDRSVDTTVADYLRDQDTALQIRMADAWIAFVSEMELLPLPDSPVTSVAFHMLVYSPDTPPAPGGGEPPASPEDAFLLRLATARKELPRFLRIRP